MEINLKETNAYLENLISIANVSIIVLDPDFHIARLNHAFEKLIGRTANEMIGTSLKVLFPPDQVEHSLRSLEATLTGNSWDTTEIDIMHKDGSIRTLVWNSATLFDSEGKKPIATIAQGHDITYERELEKEKKAALVQIKEKLVHLAFMNDEIRNPLTIMLACADTIEDKELAEKIIAQIRRIDMLITKLDNQWLESEKILEYLRKHHHITLKNEEKFFTN